MKKLITISREYGSGGRVVGKIVANNRLRYFERIPILAFVQE